MDANCTFDENLENSLEYLSEICGAEQYYDDLRVVLSVAIKDVRNLPKLGFSGTNISVRAYTQKYKEKYVNAYNRRPSVKTANPPGTYPDPIQAAILAATSTELTPEDIDNIVKGHSFLMSVENVIGDLLEEYLCDKLKPLGWFCCWGSTIDAVDFCKLEGDLLQVKNSDNSENSSSSRVRNGTEIKKWFRRFSTRENSFNWETLKIMTGARDIDEDDFRRFILNVFERNPNVVYVR